MIKLAGVAIFIFGNKLDQDGNVVPAGGVKREFEIALENGLIPVPVTATGYVAKDIYDLVSQDFQTYYKGNEEVIPLVEDISKVGVREADEIVGKIVQLIKGVNK